MEVPARLAVPDDAEELVRLRSLMFESMGLDVSEPTWRSTCQAHLREHLGSTSLIGAVVDAPDRSRLAASGLAELSVRIPSPGNPSGSSAYLSSFSTDPRWRRRGFARAVLARLIDDLESRGIGRIELHATPAGEGLYRSFGFAERDGGLEMRRFDQPR